MRTIFFIVSYASAPAKRFHSALATEGLEAEELLALPALLAPLALLVGLLPPEEDALPLVPLATDALALEAPDEVGELLALEAPLDEPAELPELESEPDELLASPSSSSTDASAGRSATVTQVSTNCPFAVVAVSVTKPCESPVSSPSLFTLATLSSSTLQVIVLSTASAGLTTAL